MVCSQRSKNVRVFTGSFPATRMRRVRRHDWSRRLVSKPTSTDDLIWPLFVFDGQGRQAVEICPVLTASVREICGQFEHVTWESQYPQFSCRPISENRRCSRSRQSRQSCLPDGSMNQEVGDRIGIICEWPGSYSSHGQDGLFGTVTLQ